MKRSIPVLVLIAVACFEAPIDAYLDPGSSSLILQGIIGGIAAALVVLKTYWHRISAMFRRTDRKSGPDALSR